MSGISISQSQSQIRIGRPECCRARSACHRPSSLVCADADNPWCPTVIHKKIWKSMQRVHCMYAEGNRYCMSVLSDAMVADQALRRLLTVIFRSRPQRV
jgi:hypothetical protein